MDSKTECLPIFKPYDQNQMMLLPPSLEELIPEQHLVRVFNGIIERMDMAPLESRYKGGGTSSYHPKLMLKVLVYGYINRIYSSRKIAKALRENVHFMWLSGGGRPDFRTINHFRSSRMKKVVDEVFSSLLERLIEMGYVKFEHYFIDGTKFMADASRHSHVWRKNTKRYQEGLQGKIEELMKQIDENQEAEDREYGDRDLEELGDGEAVTSGELKEIAEKLDDAIGEVEDKQKKKGLIKAKKKIEKEYLPRLEKYEGQERDLGGRNSCSKTDKDATFYRFKNGDLLPAYTVLMGTESQFILNYSVHQQASDTPLLIPHFEKMKELNGRKPESAIGDSGFGSEENYAYLEEQGIENYLKYNTFHQEEKRKKRKFDRDQFAYDPKEDVYTCPNGRHLRFKEKRRRKTGNGYFTEFDLYACENCGGCSDALECKRTEGPRTIQRNLIVDRYRKQAKENLTSELGVWLRKQRNIDVESVFGHIKKNMGYRRFRLRGLEKVNIEIGLISMAHNISKMFMKQSKIIPLLT